MSDHPCGPSSCSQHIFQPCVAPLCLTWRPSLPASVNPLLNLPMCGVQACIKAWHPTWYITQGDWGCTKGRAAVPRGISWGPWGPSPRSQGTLEEPFGQAPWPCAPAPQDPGGPGGRGQGQGGCCSRCPDPSPCQGDLLLNNPGKKYIYKNLDSKSSKFKFFTNNNR